MSRRTTRRSAEEEADLRPEPPWWWKDDYAEETYKRVQHIVQWAMRNFGYKIQRADMFFDDLHTTLIDATFDFMAKFNPDMEHMPEHWYAALVSYLKRASVYEVQHVTYPGNTRSLAYSSISEEYAVPGSDEVFHLGDRYEGIRSFDLLPPEPHYLILEAIAERMDPRMGPYKDPTLCKDYGCRYEAVTQGLCDTHYTAYLEAWGNASGTSEQCSVDGCNSFASKRGLCKTHYAQVRKQQIEEGTWTPREVVKGTQCSVDGCTSIIGAGTARGMCSKHYARWKLSQRPPCTIEGCNDPQASRGLCNRHYRQQRKQQKEAGNV